MQNLTKDQIQTKWGELVKQTCRLEKPEDIVKVSEFAHMMAGMENVNYFATSNVLAPQTPNLLPINFNVISKISDLSNITFALAPVFEDVQFIKEIDNAGALCLKKQSTFVKIDTYRHVLKIDKDLAYQLSGTLLAETIEKHAVEFVAGKINAIIAKPKTKLYMYIPIERIVRNTDPIEAIKADQINDNYIVYWIYSRWKEKTDESITLNDI